MLPVYSPGGTSVCDIPPEPTPSRVRAGTAGQGWPRLGCVDLDRVRLRAVGGDAEVEVGPQTTRALEAAGGSERQSGRGSQGFRV
jgi:hypothetical protein